MKCSTITDSGPVKNRTCVFPFNYRGYTYHCCTRMDNFEDEPDAWCSTEVDNITRNYIDEKWGWCEERCQPELLGTLKMSPTKNMFLENLIFFTNHLLIEFQIVLIIL